MLSTEEFAGFAKNVVLFLHNTSHVDDEPYPNLLHEKGGNGYPTVSYLDHTGRLLHQMEFEKLGMPEFEKQFEALGAWKALKAKVDGGEKKLARKLFTTELGLGMLGHAEARKRFEGLRKQFSDGEVRGIERKLITAEFQAVLRTIDLRDPKTEIAAGEKFVAMIEKDRIPQSRQIISFWKGALVHAESKGDADQFEKIMNRAKKEMGDDPRAKRYLGSVERRLERLRRKQ